MKYLEQIKQLGEVAPTEDQKVILRDYFERMKKSIRAEKDEDSKRLFCSMIRVYIMGFIDKNVDYTRQEPEYYSSIIERFLASKRQVLA